VNPRNALRPTSITWLTLVPAICVLIAAAAEAQTKAYVTSSATDSVSVIDSATREVRGTIPVGTGPTRVVMGRDGGRAYVANGGSDSISVIDVTTDTVTSTIAVGDSPSALALTRDGQWLYVMTATGQVDVVDTAANKVSSTIPLGAVGDLAVTPDGARIYVASGLVYIADTATGTVLTSFAPEESPVADVYNSAIGIALSPDGASAYIATISYNYRNGGFSAGGSLLVVETSTDTITWTIDLGEVPGPITFTPDGSRAYVGIQAFWANTGYGAAFFPGRTATVIDTATRSAVSLIDFGADGAAWMFQNTGISIDVTPDRSAVYVSVPRIGTVAVADVNTNTVTQLISLSDPGALAVVPDRDAALVPYVVDAADDRAVMTTAGGTAVANVRANDTLGGLAATAAHVVVSQLASTAESLTLDAETGQVNLAAGAEVGTYTLVYRLCEVPSVSNCDEATVTVNVRAESIVDAADDNATTFTGRTIMTSVLANDTLDGAPAAWSTVWLSQVSSTGSGLLLNVATGAIFVDAAADLGPQTLTYRICERASPSNCDDASVSITVNAYPIDAVDDSGAAPRTGGIALGSVLTNDTFAGAATELGRVRLSQRSSTHDGISLNAATGSVLVAAGTPVGTYSLAYRMCEAVNPVNCDDAVATIVVQSAVISALNDSAKASSKVANTAVASVLNNDSLAGARATAANVSLSLVSLNPSNSRIRLDLSDGSVDVLGKTDGGTYSLVYAICEIATPANCARATVTLNLSGK
jgi:YVTN family beta-propeller protein